MGQAACGYAGCYLAGPLQPPGSPPGLSYSRRVVKLAISSLVDAIKRDWWRTGADTDLRDFLAFSRLGAGNRSPLLHGSLCGDLGRTSSLLLACGPPRRRILGRAGARGVAGPGGRSGLPPLEALGSGQPCAGWLLALASVSRGRSVGVRVQVLGFSV